MIHNKFRPYNQPIIAYPLRGKIESSQFNENKIHGVAWFNKAKAYFEIYTILKDGDLNLIPWNFRLYMFLEETKIWKDVEIEIATTTNLKLLVFHVKKEAKENKIIMKFHLIPPIIKNLTSKEMFKALVSLYWSSCVC